MSHLNPPTQASGQPMKRPQGEVALFDRMIHICDRQDEIIRQQQVEIDRLRQQLAGKAEQAPPHEIPIYDAPTHEAAPQQSRPPRTEQGSIAKAPMPPQLEPMPTDPPTTKRKPISATKRNQKHARQRSANVTESYSKPCLTNGLAPGHRLLDGPCLRGEDGVLMASPPTRPKATDPRNRPCHQAPIAGGLRVGRGIDGEIGGDKSGARRYVLPTDQRPVPHRLIRGIPRQPKLPAPRPATQSFIRSIE